MIDTLLPTSSLRKLDLCAFGTLLSGFLMEQRINHEAFARQCKMSKSHFIKILKGRIPITPDMVERIFAGLDMESCAEKESFLTVRYKRDGKVYTLVIDARPKTSDEDYGVLLKQCRIAGGLTQKEVAESIGVRPTDITDFERGRIITSGTVLEKVMAFVANKRAEQVEVQLCKIRAEKGPLWITNDSVARILKRDKDAYVALRKDVAQGFDRYLYIPQEQWSYAAKDICEHLASSLPKDQLRHFHIYAAPGIWFAMRGNLTINPRTRHAWISVAGKEILCSQQDALELIYYFQKINREIDEHAAKGERVSIEGFYRLF